MLKTPSDVWVPSLMPTTRLVRQDVNVQTAAQLIDSICLKDHPRPMYQSTVIQIEQELNQRYQSWCKDNLMGMMPTLTGCVLEGMVIAHMSEHHVDTIPILRSTQSKLIMGDCEACQHLFNIGRGKHFTFITHKNYRTLLQEYQDLLGMGIDEMRIRLNLTKALN